MDSSLQFKSIYGLGTMFYFFLDLLYEENLEEEVVDEAKLPRIKRKNLLDLGFDDVDLKD